jgi:hypothetical protein
MSTYYGYAEREAEDNIDWSVVGSDITNMLQEEKTRREALKKELDDASREFGQTLADAPTGTHKGANDFITGFAGDVSQARLMQDRLLKSGQLKVKDYLLQRANITDGTKGIFNVAKNFQAEFKRKADRMTQEKSAKLEQTLFRMTEGFANFNNSGAYINPTNFQVSIAKKERVTDKNGNSVYQMSKNPQDFFTVNELNTFVSTDLERFDTEKALDDAAAAAGVRDQQITYYDKPTDRFMSLAISDVSGDVYNKNLDNDQKKLVDGYKEAEEDAINEILANPYTAASILTDYIGKGYDFTFDPDEAKKDEKMILLEKDPGGSGLPRVAVSSDQDKVLRETLARGIKYRLDQKYAEAGVEKTRFAPAKKDAALARKSKTTKNKINNAIFLSDLLYGNDDQKDDALNRLKSLNRKGVKQYLFEETGEVDDNGDPIRNLVAHVFDKTQQSGYTEEAVIEDFNNKGVNEIIRSLVFDDITHITNSEDRKHYEDIMSSVILNNFSKYKDASGNPLTAATLIPAGGGVKSGRTTPPTVPWEQRTVISSSGVTGNAQVVFLEQAKTDAQTNNAPGLVKALELSYLGVPKGSTSEIVPLAGVAKVTALSKDDVEAHGVTTTAYETLKIELDPKFSEEKYILIPVWDSTFETTNEVAKYMEGVAADIKKGKNVKKINKEDIRKLFTKTRWGTDDAEWFDLYNQAEAATTTTTTTTTAAGDEVFD